MKLLGGPTIDSAKEALIYLKTPTATVIRKGES